MPLVKPKLSFNKHNNVRYNLEESTVSFDLNPVKGVDYGSSDIKSKLYNDGYDTGLKLYKEKHDSEPFDIWNKKDAVVPNEVVKFLCKLAELCWKKCNPIEYLKHCVDLGLFPYFTGCMTLEVDGNKDNGISISVSCFDLDHYALFYNKRVSVSDEWFFDGSLGDMQWVSEYTKEFLNEFNYLDIGKVVFTLVCDVTIPHKYKTFKELCSHGSVYSYKVVKYDEYAKNYTVGYMLIDNNIETVDSRLEWVDAWENRDFTLVKCTN